MISALGPGELIQVNFKRFAGITAPLLGKAAKIHQIKRKLSKVVFILKWSSRKDPSDYRPLSLTPMFVRVPDGSCDITLPDVLQTWTSSASVTTGFSLEDHATRM